MDAGVMDVAERVPTESANICRAPDSGVRDQSESVGRPAVWRMGVRDSVPRRMASSGVEARTVK